MNNTAVLLIPEHSPWRYALVFPIMFVLGLELVLFVRLIRKYRKPYIPLLAMLGMFVLNFVLYDQLLFLPPIEFPADATPPQPSATPPAPVPSSPAKPH